MATNFFSPTYGAFDVYNQSLSSQEQKKQYHTTNFQGETALFDDYDEADNWGNGSVDQVSTLAAQAARQQALQHLGAIRQELDKIPANQPTAKTWQLANTKHIDAKDVDRYRLERIDVHHSMGDYLVNAWEEFRLLQVKNPNFWTWVSDESKDDDKVKKWNPTLYGSAAPEFVPHYLKWFRDGVKYIGDGQTRDRYWVEIKHGSLWRKKTRKDTTRDKFDTEQMIEHIRAKYKMPFTAIWVLSPADKFYSHVVKIGRFHHSSFLEGTEIQAAGEWGVDDGKLTWINGKSGHYRPELARFIDGLELLQKSGVVAVGAKVRLYKAGQTKMEAEEGLATFLQNVKGNAQHYAPLEVFS